MIKPTQKQQTAEWQTVRLGDVADLNWGDTKTTKASYIEKGFPAYSAAGPDGFMSRADFDRTGVVVSAIGADCGKTWLARGKWSCIKNTLRFWSTDPNVDTEYLYWVTRDRAMWPKRGSAQPFISQGDARAMKIRIPSLVEQRSIASILGSLDDKIELNRQMNETLERMAQALFKSWFVDFDPVRAKAEGRDTGLPKEIADLFPDSFEESEMGEIPRGWRALQLGQLLELAYGKALKDENRKIGDVPVYGSNGRVGWHDEKLVEGPGIVVGRKGNPGIVKWVQTDFFPIDTTFYVVPKSVCLSLYYLYFALLDQNLKNLSADSAVPGLNRNAAYQSLQMTPPITLLEAFNELTASLFLKIELKRIEAQTLGDIRDTVLPQLFSGGIKVQQ